MLEWLSEAMRSGGLLTLKEAAKRQEFARNGKAAPLGSMFRYVTHGLLASDGKTRVKLGAVRTPRGLMTSEPAIQEFLRRLTCPSPVGDGVPTETKSLASIERAESEMQAIGA